MGWMKNMSDDGEGELIDGVILAGGFAKRMWPLTKDMPKQLLPLAGRPMLSYVLDKLEPLKGRLDRIFLLVNAAFAHQFEAYLKTYTGPLREKLVLIVEPALQEGQKPGSLGALGQLIEMKQLRGPLLILGSDNLYDFSLVPQVAAYHETGLDVIGLYDVGDLELARLYGIASLDSQGLINGFAEKPEHPDSTLAATALWLLCPTGVSALMAYLATGHNRDALGNFLIWRIEQAAVVGHAHSGTWYDIGSLESYDAAQRWLEDVGR